MCYVSLKSLTSKGICIFLMRKMNSQILATLVLLNFLGLCYCQSEQSFSEQPTNASVLEGADATFKCTVSNQQGEVIWCRDSFCTFGRHTRNHSRLAIIGDAAKGEHHLLIRNTSINDNLSYHCQVTASEKSTAKKSHLAYLTVLLSPKSVKLVSNINNNTNNIRLTMRQNQSVECIAEDSNPPVDFHWYLDDKLLTLVGSGGNAFEISKKTEKMSNNNKLHKTIGKLIAKVDVDSNWNEKQLKCEAYNEATELQSIKITDSRIITVYYAPIVYIKMTNTANIVDIIDGEFVLFECVADSRPMISNYKWFIDDKIYSNGPNENFLSLKINAALMYKKHLKCNATNEVSTQMATYLLDITFGPKLIKPLATHKMVSLYDDLNLVCDVQSNPQANIIWKLNGTFLYAFQNLTISSVKPENYGLYTCEASLKHFPSVASSIKIVPPGPPVILAESIQYSYYGYTAKIEYFIEYEPKMDAFKIEKEDELLDLVKSSAKYQVSTIDVPIKGQKKTTLTINHVNENDFGNYTITALNVYGESKILVRLDPKANTVETFVIVAVSFTLAIIVLLSIGLFMLYRRYRQRCKQKKNHRKRLMAARNAFNLRPLGNSNQQQIPIYQQYSNFAVDTPMTSQFNLNIDNKNLFNTKKQQKLPIHSSITASSLHKIKNKSKKNKFVMFSKKRRDGDPEREYRSSKSKTYLTRATIANRNCLNDKDFYGYVSRSNLAADSSNGSDTAYYNQNIGFQTDV